MSLNTEWAPVRWRCGPIENAQSSTSSSNAENTADRTMKAIEKWTDPAMLQLLDGTSIDCLVVDWAAGGDVDAAQQKTLQPLIDAGRRKGISFVGRVTASEKLASIAISGRNAGLEALLLTKPAREELTLPVIATFSRDGVDWDRVTETFVLNGNVWPGAVVPVILIGGNTASGGPTHDPWVDSNGWAALLAHGMAPGKRLWLEIALPEKAGMQPVEKYCLALADARAHGCRWIIDLDETMRAGLADGEPKAMAAWKQICQMDASFDNHAQWAAVRPPGLLTVVSDFGARNASQSGEILNLLKKQMLPFVVADRRRSLTTAMAAKRAILWADDEVPSAEQHNELMAFVERGGMVIAPAYWGPKGIASHREDWLFGFDIYPWGKGRIVAAASGFPDVYTLARDTHILVGREHDPVRLFNPGTTNLFAGMEPGGHTEIVQIVNYGAPKPVEYITVWVNGNAANARLWTADTSSLLKGVAEDDGTSFDLPPVAIHCALEIERQA